MALRQMMSEAFPVKPAAASSLSLIISYLDLCFAHCKCSFNTHLFQKLRYSRRNSIGQGSVIPARLGSFCPRSHQEKHTKQVSSENAESILPSSIETRILLEIKPFKACLSLIAGVCVFLAASLLETGQTPVQLDAPDPGSQRSNEE